MAPSNQLVRDAGNAFDNLSDGRHKTKVVESMVYKLFDAAVQADDESHQLSLIEDGTHAMFFGGLHDVKDLSRWVGEVEYMNEPNPSSDDNILPLGLQSDDRYHPSMI